MNSIYFGSYKNSLAYLEPGSGDTPTYKNVYFCGCFAGATQLFVAVPVDLMKIKLQAYTGDITKNIYRTEIIF